MLDHAPVVLEVNAHAHVCVITRSATVYVWNVVERKQQLAKSLGASVVSADVKVCFYLYLS